MSKFNTGNFEKVELIENMYNEVYTNGESFEDYLESIDPSIHYVGTALEGLDAFERQLKRFNIKVNGDKADCVKKFFNTHSTAILFPEYVRRCVMQGMESNTTLLDIVAVKTLINGYDYRTINSSIQETKEGLDELKIQTNPDLTKIYRRGRLLISSYESLKYQRIPLLSNMLKQIGVCIRNTQMKDLVKSVINSTYESNTHRRSILNLDETASLFNFHNHNIDTIIGSQEVIRKIIRQFSPYLSYQNGLNFTKSTIKYISLNHSELKTDEFVALDSSCAIEMAAHKDICVDVESLIYKNFEKTAITASAGFSVLDLTAAMVGRVSNG